MTGNSPSLKVKDMQVMRLGQKHRKELAPLHASIVTARLETSAKEITAHVKFDACQGNVQTLHYNSCFLELKRNLKIITEMLRIC
jgi:hypothetical protein